MPLFGRRDKHKDTAPTNVPPHADSGYATSENPSSEVTATTANSGTHGLTSETSNTGRGTNSNLSNRSRPANLEVDKPTGNVIDRDTGNTVVTVTTTTLPTLDLARALLYRPRARCGSRPGIGSTQVMCPLRLQDSHPQQVPRNITSRTHNGRHQIR